MRREREGERLAGVLPLLPHVALCLFLAFLLGEILLNNLLAAVFPERFAAGVSLALFLGLTGLGAFLLWKFHGILFALERVKDRVIVAALCVLTAAQALPLLLWAEVPLRGDYNTYYNVAAHMATGQGSANAAYLATFPHAAGFPALLAPVFALLGPGIWAARLTGLLFTCLTGALVYLAAKTGGDKKSGLLAAFLWLIMPSKTLYTLVVCAENVFNALMALAVFLLVRQWKARGGTKGGLLAFAGLGVLLAALNALRPNGMLLLLVFLFCYLVWAPSGWTWRMKKINLAKLTACLLCLACFWGASRLVTAGIEGYIGQKTAATRIGWNLYVGLNEASSGAWNPPDSELFGALLREKGPEGLQQEMLRLSGDRFRNLIENGKIPSFLEKKIMAMWYCDHESVVYVTSAAPGFFDGLGGEKAWKLLCDGYYVMLLLLCLTVGVWRVIRRRFLPLSVMAALIVLGTLVLHIPFEAAMRYHNPALLWLVFFAAEGVCLFRKRTADAQR